MLVVCGRRVFFCRLYAWDWYFQSLRIAKGGEEMGFVGSGEAKLRLGFICVYVVGGGRLWLVVE